MKGLTTYRRTTKIKLKSIADSRKTDEALIKHYTFILEHFDEVIAIHDKEITEIEDVKAEVLKQFIEAPQLLKELNRHIATLKKSKQNITGQDNRVKRFKNLQERLADLRQQLKEDGIDIDEASTN